MPYEWELKLLGIEGNLKTQILANIEIDNKIAQKFKWLKKYERISKWILSLYIFFATQLNWWNNYFQPNCIWIHWVHQTEAFVDAE